MIDFRHHICGIFAGLALVAVLGAPNAASQSVTDSVHVDVLRVQSRGIYTTSENVHWIRGDTLLVLTPDRSSGEARVAGITSSTLLLSWLSGPLDVAIGDRLLLRGPRRIATAGVTAEAPNAGDRESILGSQGRTPSKTAPSHPIRVDGYYSLSVTGSMSKVSGRFTDNASSSRSFATPTSALRLRVSDLPASLRFAVNARVSRSFSSTDISGRANTLRLYELMLSGDMGSHVSYDLGRFRDASMASGGYWDGASTSLSFGRQRLGVSIGYEPDRYNQAFASDILKTAATFALAMQHAGGASSIDGAVGAITSPWLDSPYSFLSIGHRSRVQKVRVVTDVQLDRSPADQSVVLSRIQARFNVQLTENLGLNARAGSRKTFFYWLDDGAWSARRDQQQLGLTWNRTKSRFGLSVGKNAYSGRESSWSVNATARTPLPWLPVMYTNSSSMWSRSSITTWYSSHSFQHDVGRVTMSLDYALMVLDGLGPVSFSHIAGLSARLAVGERGYLAVRQRTHVGSSTLSSTLYLNFGVSF